MIKELTALVEEQRRVVEDPDEFGQANALFHERLVELTGNQTLSIVAEMLNEIVARAVTAVSQATPRANSIAVRRARHPVAGATHRADRARARRAKRKHTGANTCRRSAR